MKRRSCPRWLAALIGLAALLFSGVSTAAEVHVMVSTGFYEVYKELTPAFERTTGHQLITTRGPSMGDSPEAIPARMKRGEPVDVVIMIGASIDELGRQGLVSPGSKIDLARSQIGTVEAFRRTLLVAKSIAYSDSASGIYLSTTLFEKLGVADQVRGKSRKIKGPPSGEPVAAVVARGEAEIGFQQVSELLHVPGITFVGPIPAELQEETFFSAALASAVRQPEAGGALIRFLASPQAAPVISKGGLAPLSGR